MSHPPQRRQASAPLRADAAASLLRRSQRVAPVATEAQNSDSPPYRQDALYQIQLELEPLHEMIFTSFQPVSYHGTVVAGGDEGPWPGNQTDEEDLFRMLKRRRWTDIPADFINRHLGTFVLLTAQAFATFIPAWLVFSVENNFKGAEFVVYTFAPLDLTGTLHIRPLSVEMFRALTPLQRRTLHLFLQATATHFAATPLCNHALAASDTVDSLISVFEANRI